MQRWSTRDEQERRREAAPGEVHAGVQAGGRQAGQGRPGDVGDGARVLNIPKATLGNWVRQDSGSGFEDSGSGLKSKPPFSHYFSFHQSSPRHSLCLALTASVGTKPEAVQRQVT